MDVSWTTVISSAVSSVIASGLFSGVIAAIIQCRYDKKIQEYKSEIQQMLDEHQIRFEYWHKEKTEAIKDFYYSIIKLNYAFHEAVYLFCELQINGSTDDIKDYLKDGHLNLSSIHTKCYIKWQKLTLFLNDNEYLEINGYFDVCSKLNRRYEQYCKDNDLSSYINDVKSNLDKMNNIISNLKKMFKKELHVETTEVK